MVGLRSPHRYNKVPQPCSLNGSQDCSKRRHYYNFGQYTRCCTSHCFMLGNTVRNATKFIGQHPARFCLKCFYPRILNILRVRRSSDKIKCRRRRREAGRRPLFGPPAVASKRAVGRRQAAPSRTATADDTAAAKNASATVSGTHRVAHPILVYTS